MADPQDLARTQRRFWALVTGRGHAAENADALGISPTDVAALVQGDRLLDAYGRLDIYADMYFLRLRDALVEDFPVTLGLLGEEASHDLVVDYLDRCPPDSPTLRDLGARLPAFLRQHPIAQGRGWLAELAALEWARADVFDRADAPPLAFDDLRAVRPERFGDVPLTAIFALAIVPVGFAVDETWRQITAEAPASRCRPEPGALLVWRRDGEVRHRRATDTEREVLDLLVAGTTFVQVCARLGERRDDATAAQTAFEVLSRWLQAGLVARPAELPR